jgi:hypothetical protein
MPAIVPSIEDRIRRYHDWRMRGSVDRPMIGLIWEPDIPPLGALFERPAGGGFLLPEHIHPRRCFEFVDAWHDHFSQLPCDTIQRFTPAFGIPWIEAIAGCKVMAAPGSLWAEPCLDDYADIRNVTFDGDNPWLVKLLEFTREMAAHSRGRYPLAVPQLRGPLDALAAMRTPQQMCIDLVESPREVAFALSVLADLWIAVGGAVLADIPPFHGGYIARMGTWSPQAVLTMQNDVSTLISPLLYEGLVLPLDRKIAAHFPAAEFHMHASEHHQVPNLLKLQRLISIEFTLEHTLGGPPLDAMLPLARRILAEKPLILACLDIETARRCLTELPPAGLCLTIATNEHRIPADIVRWLADHCR